MHTLTVYTADREYAEAIVNSPIGRSVGVAVQLPDGTILKSPENFVADLDDVAIQAAMQVLDQVDQHPGKKGAIRLDEREFDAMVGWLNKLPVGAELIAPDLLEFPCGARVSRIDREAA
ncbi:MAG: hypothetical protein AAGK37_21885 [Pseudomonadota bacterium]